MSKIKRYYTITENFLNEEIPKDDQLLHPVYVTLQERVKHNDIKRKTKETLTILSPLFLSKTQKNNLKVSIII